ncbi:sepiapterin reductase [Fonsecaea pedrosoi]|nr:sepiapterin reductase [Fonsecaea pedrosoi]
MATSQASQALIRRSAADDVALMPPPPLKRIKRPPKVLDEDEYTQALSDIIARDYFPGLLESQAQHEYLAALDSGNEAWIVEAAQKLRQAAAPATGSKRRSARNTRFDRTPLATPRVAEDTPVGYTGSETPVTVAGTEVEEVGEESRTQQLDTSKYSLGSFQAKYTSEDNESFNTLLDKQNQKRREKHAHLWTQDQRLLSGRQIAYRAREAQLLKEREEDEAAGKSLVPMTTGATDARVAKPDSWKIKRPDNTLMFNATSVDEDGLQTVQEVKEQISKAGPKHVVHANTRFPPMQYVDEPGPVPPSPSLNTEIIARRTTRGMQRGDGDSATTTDFPGSETPRVNGYAFVEEDEPENLGQGTDSSAPSYRDLLAGQVGDGTPNPFKISEIRKREDLHLRILEKQARRKRERERETMKTPGPASSLFGVGGKTPSTATGGGGGGNMTPAARRLMEKLGGKTPMRAGLGLESSGIEGVDAKNMWTPGRTPRRRHTAHSHPHPHHAGK